MNVNEILKALANPQRLHILQWLKAPHEHFAAEHCRADGSVCVGIIQEKAGLSQSTISAYLATLYRAGLVSAERVGQWTYYRRNEDTIAAFITALNKLL
ncbi:ArsR/SmtB family transcription factor [Phytohalomonas tamaricis]|uniref:ArsR/SmtB family transcription factor n=1 Tax=Phytohalomonas tamaricis TaxID=2081032 RepID=UPI000D0BDEEC|nr:metalloregulator ArsR/SmtB family transcription factor [Phytohalomonas tamaricis]